MTLAEQVLLRRPDGRASPAGSAAGGLPREKRLPPWRRQGWTRTSTTPIGDRLRALGALDFDDLLSEALKLDTAGQRRFTHLLVDEFQDVKPHAV